MVNGAIAAGGGGDRRPCPYALYFHWLSLTLLNHLTFFAVLVGVSVLTDVNPFKFKRIKS